MVKPNTSNLFVLVNAPALQGKLNWEENKEIIEAMVLNKLEEKGLTNLKEHIVYKSTMTPENIAQQTAAYKGAIYGMSSNRFKQAFFRVPNKDFGLDNLWYVGGSAHPGGGTPIVTLSGQLVAKEITGRHRMG